MKKGFTLIEVIGILVLLTIIFGITFPVVTSVINRSKDKMYEDQINIIYSAAESYALKNSIQIPYKISIQTLKNNDYLSTKQITNARTNETMDGCIIITFNPTNNKYSKVYEEATCITGIIE